MILQNYRTYSRCDEDFDLALEELQKKYFHNGGDEDAEVIINWNKREAKEDGVGCIFAANLQHICICKLANANLQMQRFGNIICI